MSYPAPIDPNAIWRRRLYGLGVAAVLLCWLLPLVAIMLTAIRANEDLMLGNYWGWPSSFDLVENYRAVFTGTPILRFLVNSFIITLPSVLFVLVLSTLAGFALSRYRFRGSTLILGLFIAGNFIPPQILMIPVRNLMTALGLYDTFWALIIFHTAFQTGFATMFMRAFIAQLPSELFEAARVDGATPLQMLSMIVTPLVRPALAALGVLTFTFVWNEYFWALILVQSDQVKPVTLGLATLKGQYITAWNLVSAATIFVALPPVLLFFLMQKHFVAGLTVGAVKG